MERFHDELRQENRGIKRGGLKDSDEHIRKRNKVMDNEVEMSGDGFKNQDAEVDVDCGLAPCPKCASGQILIRKFRK